MSHPPTAPQENTSGVDVLRLLLLVLAILLFVSGLGAAVLGALFPTPGSLSAMLMVLLGCVCLALLMLALAAALKQLAAHTRQVQLLHSSIEALNQSSLALQETIATLPQQYANPGPLITPPPTPEEQQAAAANAQSLDMLSQLRDLLMMNEEQRAVRGRQHWQQRQEFLRKTIDQHIAAGEWTQAESQVKELHAVAPDDPSVETLARKIDDEQTRRRTAAVNTARERIRHIMSITAWAQADEVVRALRVQFPASPEVAAVAADLAREREVFDKETIQRLFHDLKDASEHRLWRRAYETAEELIRRYPNEKKVEKLKTDIATIKENAESQERREQEELFKDLLKRQRYDEALAVATAVINKYPASTAAAELNKLLPKVEELIRQAHLAKQTPVV